MAPLLNDWLFPLKCVVCGKEDVRELLCEKCFAEIRIKETLFCGECRARLAGGKKICHKNFPYVLGMATDYDEPGVRELISGFKFKFWTEAAKPLGKILATYARKLPIKWEKALILPVPLSRQRERERGFNQSRILAEEFAKDIGSQLEFGVLVRVKNSKPQSELDFHKRLENVRGVFAVQNREILKGQKIVLIDDVVTSGSTFFEAASILKEAGARGIIAIAVAGA